MLYSVINNSISMKKERELMSSEEFAKYIGAGQLKTFEAVGKFKSVRRAIRRGHVSPLGEIYPRRPFSNKKATKGRKLNELKKCIYERIKHGRI